MCISQSTRSHSLSNYVPCGWKQNERKRDVSLAGHPYFKHCRSLPLLAFGSCLVQRVCYCISTRCDRWEMQMCHCPSGASSREQSKCAGKGSSPSLEQRHIVRSERKLCGSNQPQQRGKHPPSCSLASACWGWDHLDIDVYVWPSYHRAHFALGWRGDTDSFGCTSSCSNADCLK